MKLSSMSSDHQDSVAAILSKFGKPEVCNYGDHIEWTVPLDTQASTTLIIRYVGPRYGAGWICLLDRWGRCFAQSSGDDESPARLTPQAAYDNLLVRYQESICKDQALLDSLRNPHLGLNVP